MEKIIFREVKGLGTILQDSARFIKQNFLQLIKLTLLWVIAPMLIGAVLIGLTYSRNMASVMSGEGPMANSAFHFIQMLAGYLFYGIAMIFMTIIILSYIRQYVEGKATITMSDVWPDIKYHFFRILFSSIAVVILIYFGMILCLIPGIYLSVALSPLITIMVIENRGFSYAWNRSFFLIKDEWWSTFGLYIVTGLITMAISSIVIVPMYIFIFVKMFTGLDQNPGNPEAAMQGMEVMAWFIPVYYLITFLTGLIFITVVAFKYYSLVELKEGLGEKEAIRDIGSEG